MSTVLDVRAMFINQLRQNRLIVNREAGFLYLPSASQFSKLHVKTLLKLVDITKILILHGCCHDVRIKIGVDA